jgi:hypothetical protein
MSSSFQTTRINELLLDLVCCLDPGHGHESLPRSVRKYAAALGAHRYLTPMQGDVERGYAGLVEKLAVSGRRMERWLCCYAAMLPACLPATYALS